MIVPSQRVWEEMGRERAGFWPSLLGDGRTHAFLLKLPTHVIKAAYRSCPMSLFVSAARTDLGYVLSTAVRVVDDPESPLILTGVHLHEEEQEALRQALSSSQTMICFYDELARPVLRGECVLESAACEVALRDFRKDDNWYVGPWSGTLVKLLDEIVGKIDSDIAVPQLYAPSLNAVPLTLVIPEIIQIVAVGSEEVREVRLEGRDEGYGLEQGVWHLLEGLFGRGIYHSPQVQKEDNVRELTDVLCFGPEAAFLVESKAVAVLSTDPERSTERRARNIEKQIEKGIKQVGGALRAIKAGSPITSKKGKPIPIPDSSETEWHGIVMISEMLPSVDWTSVAARLAAAARKTGEIFSVLDLQELRVLVGVSDDDPLRFRQHLCRRSEILRQSGSALIETRVQGPPPP